MITVTLGQISLQVPLDSARTVGELKHLIEDAARNQVLAVESPSTFTDCTATAAPWSYSHHIITQERSRTRPCSSVFDASA